jgi:hypothetical protein
MTDKKRPVNGEKFSVQIFWIGELINNRLNRIALGPFVDWPTAYNERKALPDPENYLIMRTESDIIVDDTRSIL